LIELFITSAPVDRLLLLDDNSQNFDNATLSPLTIHLIENHPFRLRCISFGGYPPPNLELHIGTRDVTAEFSFFNEASMTGRDGLKVMTYRTERWTNNYLARAEDDAQPLACIAFVPGLGTVTEISTLDVDCK